MKCPACGEEAKIVEAYQLEDIPNGARAYLCECVEGGMYSPEHMVMRDHAFRRRRTEVFGRIKYYANRRGMTRSEMEIEVMIERGGYEHTEGMTEVGFDYAEDITMLNELDEALIRILNRK